MSNVRLHMDTISLGEAFSKAKAIAAALEASLPAKVEARALTLNSKIPFKTLSLRETLIHRTSALATPAVSLFETENFVAGIILTRAVVETVAVTFGLRREITRFLDHGSVEDFNDFLNAGLVGSRWPNAETPARSVLTLVDHVDREFKGYRETYDSLCEFSHPNWSGVLGAFGTIDYTNHILHLGPREEPQILIIGVTSLAMTLGLFQYAYNDMIDSLHALDNHFEQSRE